ncbi:hypothetical protein ACFSKU_05620 [Pontibacter silvestris]|uniref:Lipoprotein n=1 Tax=Pontibacter silvestris TaxID=2305183 RepID=A0ABW4WWV0_9BACT|nr:hypothetical protein [Pontibacter silvestris]MCC9137016.1 hypothetical protein [Pontibacter silvestris]
MKHTSTPHLGFCKKLLLLLVLASFTGCIPHTTHTASLGGCPNALTSGEKVLIGEAKGVTANQSYKLYEKLAPQVSETGLLPSYVVEQDMYLRMHGIKPDQATDTSNLAKMQQLGYGYYLQLSVGNLEAGLGYYSDSADEIRQMQQYEGLQSHADDTKATVHFQLYSTQTRNLIYTLATTTEMSGISLPNKDYENGYRGKTTLNVSTVPSAVSRALQKGTKKLLKNCNCCQ